jgi:bifunctional oligoribonuclease and PAP phosphatase NrnA
MTFAAFAQILHEKLLSIHHVALIAHRAPDGDAYGSLEGMRQLLISQYPQLTVSVVIPPERQVDSHVSWILSTTPLDKIPESAELVLLLDASMLHRTALNPADFPTQPVITIDHHEPQTDSIEGYCDIDAPSTTIILTDIARILHWEITPIAATALLLGIYTDTGGFIHRNSNQRAFETAGFLLSAWADQARITSDTFGNYSLEYLHDLGHGLLSIVQKGNIACLFYPESDNNTHLKSHIIGYLSGLANIDIACVLMQKGDEVKGSFRTRKEGIDVNILAQKFGWGGHKKAAGFILSWEVNDTTLSWNGRVYSAEEFIDYLANLMDADMQNSKGKEQNGGFIK